MSAMLNRNIWLPYSSQCEQWMRSYASNHVLICTVNRTFNILWKAKLFICISASAKGSIDGSFCGVSTTKIWHSVQSPVAHLHKRFSLRDCMEIKYVSVATEIFLQDIQVVKECYSTCLEIGSLILWWSSFEMLHWPLSFFPLAATAARYSSFFWPLCDRQNGLTDHSWGMQLWLSCGITKYDKWSGFVL